MADTRQALVEKIERRDAMEARMEELMQALEASGFGLSGGLIDDEGFPISDVPKIIEVRTARRELAELRTDYALLQREIEAGVFAVFAREEGDELPPPLPLSSAEPSTASKVSVESLAKPASEAKAAPKEALEAFAKIGAVMGGSPAAKAGLKVDDKLLQFGYVKAQNHNQLQALRDVVIANLDHDVGMRVERGGKTVVLNVRPGKWAGKGVLG